MDADESGGGRKRARGKAEAARFGKFMGVGEDGSGSAAQAQASGAGSASQPRGRTTRTPAARSSSSQPCPAQGRKTTSALPGAYRLSSKDGNGHDEYAVVGRNGSVDGPLSWNDRKVPVRLVHGTASFVPASDTEDIDAEDGRDAEDAPVSDGEEDMDVEEPIPESPSPPPKKVSSHRLSVRLEQELDEELVTYSEARRLRSVRELADVTRADEERDGGDGVGDDDGGDDDGNPRAREAVLAGVEGTGVTLAQLQASAQVRPSTSSRGRQRRLYEPRPVHATPRSRLPVRFTHLGREASFCLPEGLIHSNSLARVFGLRANSISLNGSPYSIRYYGLTVHRSDAQGWLMLLPESEELAPVYSVRGNPSKYEADLSFPIEVAAKECGSLRASAGTGQGPSVGEVGAGRRSVGSAGRGKGGEREAGFSVDALSGVTSKGRRPPPSRPKGHVSVSSSQPSRVPPEERSLLSSPARQGKTRGKGGSTPVAKSPATNSPCSPAARAPLSKSRALVQKERDRPKGVSGPITEERSLEFVARARRRREGEAGRTTQGSGKRRHASEESMDVDASSGLGDEDRDVDSSDLPFREPLGASGGKKLRTSAIPEPKALVPSALPEAKALVPGGGESGDGEAVAGAGSGGSASRANGSGLRNGRRVPLRYHKEDFVLTIDVVRGDLFVNGRFLHHPRSRPVCIPPPDYSLDTVNRLINESFETISPNGTMGMVLVSRRGDVLEQGANMDSRDYWAGGGHRGAKQISFFICSVFGSYCRLVDSIGAVDK